MNKIISICVAVIICFSVGFTAAYFQADAIHTWYPFLNKPSLTPPNFIFPSCMESPLSLYGDIDRTNMEY